jgi:DNA-binding transcriptional ArsR family regulator
MKIDKDAYQIFKVLKDDSRLAVFLLLITNEKLTLKQLSDALEKGKTTIHHHIRRLEEEGIVVWKEREDDKKKLKTRYYSLDQKYLQNIFGMQVEEE